MIPPAEELESLYSSEECKVLEAFRPMIDAMDPKVRSVNGRKLLRKLWPDELQYISKTHWIQSKDNPGTIKLLTANYAQKRFYEDVIVYCRNKGLPIRAVILKARQLGFSTFIQAWQYEQCDRESHRSALTLSYDDSSAEELFQKSVFIRSRQWFPRGSRRERTSTLEFADNGSVFHTKTAGNLSAGRSLTLHHVHCSEIPMWQEAGETLLALMQAVPIRADTSIFFESTAKGRRGEFYDAWKKAEAGESNFVPFFAPWFWDPNYVLGFPSTADRDSFAQSLDLTERNILRHQSLSYEQLHWRRYKIKNDLQGSEAKFRQEFPGTAEEAFLTSGSPVFKQEVLAELEMNATPPQWTGNIHLLLPT